jgi:alkanesulfonate monooxygenase SsuD/methylene tetrahydromethanopterin reductase-like flavin-dependent oxidoreductase (luciferase family)
LRTGSATFDGRYYQAVDCVLSPPDDRPGGIPILIASAQPRMTELTARFADQWNTAWWGDIDGYALGAANLDAACERVGRDPGTIAKTAGVTIEFTDDTAPADSYDPARVVKGPIEHVAGKLARYSEAGCAHLIGLMPNLTDEKVEKLAAAAKMAGLIPSA